MRETEYPGYAAHKAEHENFVLDLRSIKASHAAHGPSTALVLEVNNRVCSWLRGHILRVDRALASHLRVRQGRP